MNNPDFLSVFIVGNPRSGKTLLQSLLGYHGDFAWFSQYYLKFRPFPMIGTLNKIYNHLRVNSHKELLETLHVDILDGRYFVPQHRERILIVGYLSDMAQQGYNTQNISDFHKKMVPYLIKKYACASKKDLIVDIGSGQGHALIPLWNEGYSNLVAIDIEADNFEEFELKYNIRSHVCNIENQKNT